MTAVVRTILKELLLAAEPLVIETTIQPGPQTKQIGYIADMAIFPGGLIATADSGLGVSTVLTDEGLETTSCSGRDNAFDSTRVR